jgi:hypothetical protein
MISWRLWQALEYPVYDHPVFHRTLASYGRRAQVIESSKTRQGVIIISHVDAIRGRRSQSRDRLRSLTYSALVLLFLCGGWIPLLIAIILVIPFVGTIYGLDIATRVSTLVSREREYQMFDLLSLAPPGALGLSWALMTGLLYRNAMFRRLRRVIGPTFLWLIIVLGFGLLILAFEIWGGLATPSVSGRIVADSAQQQFANFVLLMVVVTGLYVDVIHSIVTGAVTAILAASVAKNRLEARILALALYLGTQIVTYLAVLTCWSAFLPQSLPMSDDSVVSDWIGRIISYLMVLVVFIAIREGLIHLLWQSLANQLQISRRDLDVLMERPVREIAMR